MTFDDQIRRTFGTMSERLHAALDHQIEILAEEFAVAAKAAREQAVSEARDVASREATGELEAAVATARLAAREEALAAGKEDGHREGLEEGRRLGFEAGRTQGLEEGRQQGVEEGRVLGLEAGREHGLEAGRQQGSEEGRQQGFDEGRQQGVLEGRQAAEEESREALAAAVAAAHAEHVAPPASATGDTERLAESVRSMTGARSLTEILDTLVSCAGRETGHAGVWVIRGGRLRHWRSTAEEPAAPDLALDDQGAIADAARTNAVADSGGTLAVPIAMSGQVVAVLVASPGAEAGSEPPNRGAIEILARYAARCLEAITAFKAARALTERPGEPGGDGPAASHDARAEEDAAARRFARLLVSEIKLYHEAAVVDGRRDRDLARRLGGEIARARVLYEQRVPPQVRQRADFFHDELVHTLANGDATLLQLT